MHLLRTVRHREVRRAGVSGKVHISQVIGVDAIRILTGVVRALEELKVKHPEKHIVMLEEEDKPAWRQAIFLVKKTPFLPEEIGKID